MTDLTLDVAPKLGGHDRGDTGADYQNPGPHRIGLPSSHRRPIPGWTGTLRIRPRRRRTAPQPVQSGHRPAAPAARTDPKAAPVVQRIFTEFLAGRGLYAIAERLTADGILSPSAHDPARNRHRSNSKGAWSKSAVRAILRNPRYTSYQVWNRQARHEILIDVGDVALATTPKCDGTTPANGSGQRSRPIQPSSILKSSKPRSTSSSGPSVARFAGNEPNTPTCSPG